LGDGRLAPVGQGSASLAERANGAGCGECSFRLGIGDQACTRRIELPDDFVPKIGEAGFHLLPTSAELFWRSGHLPRHHGDPFDRLIIAQALENGLTVMTSDPIFPSYGVAVVDAGR